MKKRTIVCGLILLLVIVGVAGAQNSSKFGDNTSEFFVKTVPIDRVYEHRLGYRIAYTKSDHTLGYINVPHDWFYRDNGQKTAPKAELVQGGLEEYPFFSIFWRNGEFHHIRLYLREDLNHNSYGDLNNPAAFDEEFEVKALEPEF